MESRAWSAGCSFASWAPPSVASCLSCLRPQASSDAGKANLTLGSELHANKLKLFPPSHIKGDPVICVSLQETEWGSRTRSTGWAQWLFSSKDTAHAKLWDTKTKRKTRLTATRESTRSWPQRRRRNKNTTTKRILMGKQQQQKKKTPICTVLFRKRSLRFERSGSWQAGSLKEYKSKSKAFGKVSVCQAFCLSKLTNIHRRHCLQSWSSQRKYTETCLSACMWRLGLLILNAG